MTANNETIMIQWNDTLFSENIFAWFEGGMLPVFASRLEDLMLPEDFTSEEHTSGSYEIFGWDEDADDYLYVGRLFTAKGKPLTN